jgi:hypothetical protein
LVNVSEATGADISVSNVNWIDGDFPVLSVPENLIIGNLQDKCNILDVPQWCWSCRYLFRSDFIKKNELLFDEALTFQEDIPYICIALEKSNYVATVPAAIYYYVNRSNSLVNQNHKKIAGREQMIKDLCLYKKQWLEKNHINMQKTAYLLHQYKFLYIPLLMKRVYSKYGIVHKISYTFLGIRLLRIQQKRIKNC